VIYFSHHTVTAAATIAILTTVNTANKALLLTIIDNNIPDIDAANEVTNAKLNAILFFMCLCFLFISEYTIKALHSQILFNIYNVRVGTNESDSVTRYLERVSGINLQTTIDIT
jgi:hypothetical protein